MDFWTKVQNDPSQFVKGYEDLPEIKMARKRKKTSIVQNWKEFADMKDPEMEKTFKRKFRVSAAIFKFLVEVCRKNNIFGTRKNNIISGIIFFFNYV
jgi:hypothetical protein